jgi:hypothetical protein
MVVNFISSSSYPAFPDSRHCMWLVFTFLAGPSYQAGDPPSQLITTSEEGLQGLHCRPFRPTHNANNEMCAHRKPAYLAEFLEWYTEEGGRLHHTGFSLKLDREVENHSEEKTLRGLNSL